MLITTTSTLDGKRITKYLGLVSGEAILGANIFRDLFAGIRDIVGGRSAAYEQELRKAKDIAVQEMLEQAQALGANAVVGVDLDYETVGQSGGMLMVSASGTAVVRSRRSRASAGRARRRSTALSGTSADREDVLEIVGRARNDVDADEFADAPGGRGAGVGGGFDGGDVATDDRRHQSGVDFLPADEHHVGGLDHRVGGFDHADQSARFHHAERFADVGFVARRVRATARFYYRSRRLRPDGTAPNYERQTHGLSPWATRPAAPRRSSRGRRRAPFRRSRCRRPMVDLVDQVGDDAGVIGEDADAVAGFELGLAGVTRTVACSSDSRSTSSESSSRTGRAW